MFPYRKTSSMSLAGLLLLASTATVAQPNVEQRLQRLENLLGSQVLMEQSQRMEQIQQELASLRGLIENQQHELETIKQRQRNLYQDMDRRLHDLEIKGGAAPTSMAYSGTPGEPAAGSAAAVPPSGVAAPAAAVEAPVAAVAAGGDKNGKEAYSQAFNILKQGKYSEAIQAFSDFRKTYPESAYGANALYWLGEAYSASRDYKSALKEFQQVVEQYPQSNKMEGAMLKIGFTYYEMEDWTAAKKALETVVGRYPGSSVANKAQERLQRMKREGH